jgi:hypothetical protein
VLAEAWHAKNAGPPELMGQLLHLFEAPNCFGLPAFYTLHVWAWKPSLTGPFVNWHANVSCDAYSGQHPWSPRGRPLGVTKATRRRELWELGISLGQHAERRRAAPGKCAMKSLGFFERCCR